MLNFVSTGADVPHPTAVALHSTHAGSVRMSFIYECMQRTSLGLLYVCVRTPERLGGVWGAENEINIHSHMPPPFECAAHHSPASVSTVRPPVAPITHAYMRRRRRHTYDVLECIKRRRRRRMRGRVVFGAVPARRTATDKVCFVLGCAVLRARVCVCMCVRSEM